MYREDARTDGRGAAIATIVFAPLGVAGGVVLLWMIGLIAAAPAADAGGPALVAVGIGTLLYTAVLAVGVALLATHRLTGRNLIVAGAVIALLVAVVPAGSASGMDVKQLLGPAVTLICALLPGTRAWCEDY